MFKIQVPASSANIGPGFDSAGIAINRYLTLTVTRQDTWEFEHHSPLLPEATHYTEHFIYQVANKIAETFKHDLPASRVIMESEIPLARGLGSSASAVIAGIELANQLCDLNLPTDEKLQLATEIEGHPDNVAPALLGGFTVTASSKGSVDYVKLPHLTLDVVMFIPQSELKTEDSRNVLPEVYGATDVAKASGASNVMIAALLSEDFTLAGKMMESDLFHEPYRKKLIPNYDKIKKQAKKHGAYGTVISGAGPTMMSFVPKGLGENIAETMRATLSDYDIINTTINENGLQVIKTAAT